VKMGNGDTLRSLRVHVEGTDPGRLILINNLTRRVISLKQ
jgi:hypothetical protein